MSATNHAGEGKAGGLKFRYHYLTEFTMGVVMLYGVSIRDAIASNDLEKMKAVAEQAKQTIREQKDLHVALIDLLDAIDKLEKR